MDVLLGVFAQFGRDTDDDVDILDETSPVEDVDDPNILSSAISEITVRTEIDIGNDSVEVFDLIDLNSVAPLTTDSNESTEDIVPDNLLNLIPLTTIDGPRKHLISIPEECIASQSSESSQNNHIFVAHQPNFISSPVICEEKKPSETNQEPENHNHHHREDFHSANHEKDSWNPLKSVFKNFSFWIEHESENRKKISCGGNGCGCSISPFPCVGKLLQPLVDNSPFFPDSDEAHEIFFKDLRQMVWVGSGSQGSVYRSTYKNQVVAVKKLNHVGAKEFKDIKMLSRFRHENIVNFYGYTTSPICLIMEYCPGGSLFDFINSRKIPPRAMVDFALQVASGMEYLHTKTKIPIVHRDLKSLNILLNEDYTLKISDFGTCREIHGKSTKMTFAGTVAWMAPELIRNQKCTEKVDVWSFGVVLWELATGNVPYADVESTAIIWGVGSNNLHLPIPDQLPVPIANLMRSTFHPKPKKRPNFGEILETLQSISSSNLPDTPLATYYSIQDEMREEIRLLFLKMNSIESSSDESECVNSKFDGLKNDKDTNIIAGLEHDGDASNYQEVNIQNMIRDLKEYEQELSRRELELAERERRSGIYNPPSDFGDQSTSSLALSSTQHNISDNDNDNNKFKKNKDIVDLILNDTAATSSSMLSSVVSIKSSTAAVLPTQDNLG